MDFKPLLGDVLHRDDTLYISPYMDEALERNQKGIFKEIKKKLNINNPRIEAFKKNELMEPYSEEDILAIENIEGVDKVLRHLYFDVMIHDKPFILVALPPKEYAKYQYNIDMKHYPEDHEEGIIMYSEAAKVLLEDGQNTANSLVGEETQLKIYNYKSIPIKLPTIVEGKNIINTKIIDIIDKKCEDNTHE